MPEIADINPFSSVDLGLGMSGNITAIFIIAILILVGITSLIVVVFSRRRFYIKIPLWKNIGNQPKRVGIYRARIFPIGKAGDRLWFVKGAKKYIAPAIIQTAPNEYPHWEREDGEWINFGIQDLDEEQKKAGIKFIHQDMRSQRIATSNLLEQRLMQKGFWEKYGVVIGYVIFFLVISIAVVMNLYMMQKTIEHLSPLIDKITEALDKVYAGERGIVPAPVATALAFFMFRRKKIDKLAGSKLI